MRQESEPLEDIRLLYIDLFCGAGGTSTGVERARLGGVKIAKVIACVNHDSNAIASHAANHPDALHFTEDIRKLDLAPLVAHKRACKERYPRAKVVLWASTECTNYSRAKGGLPRDPDSRTLSEHLYRYIEALEPDIIQVENVIELMSWGDLDENGHPVSAEAGRLYLKWVDHIKGYGYRYAYRIMNAADYGAYTSRRRYFGMFAKGDLPIVFPEPTHSKDGTGGKARWKAVKDVLDFSDEGTDIFDRKTPLVEATLERIHAGLVKFVAGGRDNYLRRLEGAAAASREQTIPGRTAFLSKQYSGEPESKNIPVDGPAGSITTIDHHAYVSAYYGSGYNSSVEEPAPTLTTKDRLSIVQSRFLDQQYGNSLPSDVDKPVGAITTVPKYKLVTCKAFLTNPYSFKSDGSSVDAPSPTLIAHMDKAPLFLATTETGETYIEIYDTDSPMTVKIKEFMALYGIVSVKMRMLRIKELKRIMGFGDEYILVGTQAEQKKYIGNAVHPCIPVAWCAALVENLRCRQCRKDLRPNGCGHQLLYGEGTGTCLKDGSLLI